MSAAQALAAAARRLADASDTPRLDAELLLAHALGIEREALLLSDGAEVPDEFDALVRRRAAGEPLAYIVGWRDFWTIRLEVGPGVLIPRPDSETLLEAAVRHFAGTPGPATVLDLGTGPGTLLLAALDQWPEASGLGIDRSDAALAYARRNSERLGMAGRAEWRTGDWAEGVRDPFDLVLANPPYVATGAATGPGVASHEPAEALFAGADGLDAIRRLLPQLPALVSERGIALVEIGHDQAQSAIALVPPGMAGGILHDLGGRARVVALSRE